MFGLCLASVWLLFGVALLRFAFLCLAWLGFALLHFAFPCFTNGGLNRLAMSLEWG
jgi:hypothetical protein